MPLIGMLFTENTLTKSLIDTNILVYAYNVDSPFHEKAKKIIQKAVKGEIPTAVSIQNLVELYAVITDKRRVEHPLSPIRARDLIEFYKCHENIQVIAPSSRTLEILTGLIEKHKSRGQSIFDFLLAATMIDNDIREIYTSNTTHFQPFEIIKTINPLHS